MPGNWVSNAQPNAGEMMTSTEKRNRRLTGVFLLGMVFLNFPILSMVNRDITFLGLPFLYVYLFAVWLAMIVLMVFTTRPRKSETFYDYSD